MTSNTAQCRIAMWKQAMNSLNESELARIGGVLALFALVALGAPILRIEL